jgi:hypothetical protein
MRLICVFIICFILFLSGCIGSENIIPLDLESGKIRQGLLIEEYFGNINKKTDATALLAFQEGKRKSVSAAWWGFNSEDATTILQAAFDSGAEIVLVPAMDAPWVVESLFVRSNTFIILEEGVELIAKKGSFLQVSQSLLNLVDIENVKIWGFGATFRMRKEDYMSAPYMKGEWRHTIKIRGGKNISIAGIIAEKSGGDGIYLGRGKKRITNTDIILQDIVLRDHYRQGISVITAENLLIENVQMTGTSGTAPSAGIDFESNHYDEPITHCVLRNCLLANNAGAGLLCVFEHHNRDSAPFDIVLEECTIQGNFIASYVSGISQTRGRIIFKKNKIYGLSVIPSAPGNLEIVNE